MQDLIIEITTKRAELNLAISELKKRGQKKAECEADYRKELAKKILFERENGVPVTIIHDICKGDPEIARLKTDRIIAETLYESAMQKIHAVKLEMRIIESQIEAERRGL